MRCLFLLLVLGVGGCVSLSEAQLELREYRRIDFEARFKEDRRRCHSLGKQIFVMAQGNVGRDGIPATGTRYSCI